MTSTTLPRVLDLGDTAFTVEFGDAIRPDLQAQVRALDQAITAARSEGLLGGVIETVPTFRSLTVVFDPLVVGRAELVQAILSPLDTVGTGIEVSPRHWIVPICYDGEAGPDLAFVGASIDLDVEAVIRLHSQQQYVVYMLGFLPGFPFMGDLPEALHLPRRTEPRLRVPPGSVAVANGLTAIYPWESPGGWHLIGRSPLRLFDSGKSEPSLLHAGDHVSFQRINMHEYDLLAQDIAGGRFKAESWCTKHHTPEGVPCK